MKDAPIDTASEDSGKKRQTGCLGVEQSCLGEVTPKAGLSVTTEGGGSTIQILSSYLRASDWQAWCGLQCCGSARWGLMPWLFYDC